MSAHFYYLFQLLWVFLLLHRLSLVAASRTYSLVAPHRGASLIAERRLWALDFSSCGLLSLEHDLSSCQTRG